MDMRSMMAPDDEPDAAVLAEPSMDLPPAIGGNERRMHVRAYNYWASLLNGRVFPSRADLDPASIGDFGPHGVLLDFSVSRADPAIAWLGQALRDEGGHVQPVRTLADIPGRSLLSRLSDHYQEVVANRAPIGFEAEFENIRGNHTLYRGILMPFSTDGQAIDYIYGVINWKEVADAALVAHIAAEVAHAPAAVPRAAPAVHAWADGPGRTAAPIATSSDAQTTADLLVSAREGVDVARSTETRARAALHRAIGLAYDVLLAAEADRIEGLRLALGGPSTRLRIAAIVTQVFGPDEPVQRRSDYAAILSWGVRMGVPAGGLRMLLERRDGGLRAVVADERQARRNARHG